MSKIEELCICPGKFYKPKHYLITYEDGKQMTFCASNVSLLPDKIAQTQLELWYICHNIFDISTQITLACGLNNSVIMFPDNYWVIYEVNPICSLYKINGIKGLFQTESLYELLDFLRKRYSNILKPIKMGLKYEE